ncbi:MAG: hypothetical protein IT319_16890, partial [Anaerolineae bacterium]|nr:hypothetical protein [Anaerolineae bacterium]
MSADERLGISAPWMRVSDLEPTQWGRLYNLLVQPNRASTGLYILHDHGKVVTVTPAYAQSQLGLPPEIDDAEVAAAELYPIWGKGPVAIFEKQALRATFDRIQRARTDGDDIFTFLIKLANEWANEAGIVVHPNPFEKWRTVSPALPGALARAITPDGARASVLFTIYNDNELYLSLLLGFENRELTLITTLSEEPIADWRADHRRLLALAAEKYAPVAFGVFC